MLLNYDKYFQIERTIHNSRNMKLVASLLYEIVITLMVNLCKNNKFNDYQRMPTDIKIKFAPPIQNPLFPENQYISKEYIISGLFDQDQLKYLIQKEQVWIGRMINSLTIWLEAICNVMLQNINAWKVDPAQILKFHDYEDVPQIEQQINWPGNRKQRQ